MESDNGRSLEALLYSHSSANTVGYNPACI